jgi:hydroxypyruvate isomerase
MEKQLFEDVPVGQRAEHLEANAVKVEEMTYHKALNEAELEKERLRFSQLAIEISSKQDRRKLVEDYKKTLQMIKTKQREVTENVYHLADHAEGMMCTYNNRGELIGSRRLTPEEHQLSIHSGRVMKVAQNG